jgi:hypothetical protein
MPSTNRTAILTRTGQAIAAAALIAGVAFGANHTVVNSAQLPANPPQQSPVVETPVTSTIPPRSEGPRIWINKDHSCPPACLPTGGPA